MKAQTRRLHPYKKKNTSLGEEPDIVGTAKEPRYQRFENIRDVDSKVFFLKCLAFSSVGRERPINNLEGHRFESRNAIKLSSPTQIRAMWCRVRDRR